MIDSLRKKIKEDETRSSKERCNMTTKPATAATDYARAAACADALWKAYVDARAAANVALAAAYDAALTGAKP